MRTSIPTSTNQHLDINAVDTRKRNPFQYEAGPPNMEPPGGVQRVYVDRAAPLRTTAHGLHFPGRAFGVPADVVDREACGVADAYAADVDEVENEQAGSGQMRIYAPCEMWSAGELGR